MKALRWHGRDDIRLDTVPQPQPTRDELLISVSACGICGSDLKEWRSGPVVIVDGEHPATRVRPPITMGHEFIGVVADMGSDVRGWKVGDRVALEAEMRCGTCWQCVRGNYHLCAMAAYLGFNADGGLAEFVTLNPAQAIRIPDTVSDDEAALLEPLSVAVHAARRGAVELGDSVAVQGCGAVGLGVLAAVRAKGAGVIAAIDPTDRRRGLAIEMGANLAFVGADEAAEHDATSEVASAGGYDVVFECSGHPAGVQSAIDLTRRGGTIVTVGLFTGPVPVDLNAITMNERKIVGSLGYQRDFPRAMALLGAGRIDASAFVTAKVALDDVIDGGFVELYERGGNHVKILVVP